MTLYGIVAVMATGQSSRITAVVARESQISPATRGGSLCHVNVSPTGVFPFLYIMLIILTFSNKSLKP